MSHTSAAEVVERIGFGPAQWKGILAGGGVWLADGAELLLISSVTRSLPADWNLLAWQKGMVVSVVYFGVLIGNLASGVVGDRMGRRFPILASYAGICMFSLLSVLSFGFYSMAATRFFVGISFGLGQPAFNSYIGEITPSTHRLQMNAVAQALFTAGELYSGFLIWSQDPFMMNLNWRLLICFGAVPSAVFGVVAIFKLQESPSFLLVTENAGEAQKALEAIRDDNGVTDMPISLSEPSQGRSQTRRPSLTIREKVGIVLGRHLLYTTLVVCLSVFTLNFLFYGGLYAFPQVLPHLKLHVASSVNLILGALVEFPGYLLGTVLGYYTPRKTCMLLYLLATLASTLVFSFASMRILSTQLEGGLETMAQLGLIGHKIFVSVGFLIVYVYAQEIYPTVARTTGGSFCLAAGRLGAMAAPSAFENLYFITGSHTAFFNATAVICAINAMLVLFLPYETKDIILKDHLDEEEPIAPPKQIL